MNDKKRCATCHNDCANDVNVRQCDKCKNKRVIEWVKITDELPEKNQRYLVMYDNIEPEYAIGFSSFFIETKEFNHTNITHWADISRLAPSDNI